MGGVVGGVQGGVVGGVVGGVLGGQLGGQLGSTQAIPFGAGMERPSLQKQVLPVYNQQAMAARLETTAIVKCTIIEDGSLSNCRIIKHLPLEMDGPLLAAVSQWKYTPVMFQGRPARVDYTITVHVKPP